MSIIKYEKRDIMVKISVVMPVYNAEQFIKRAIDSVYKQTFKDVEIVCVDDGSTDNSVQILEELKKQNDAINIIQQENSGSGKARNNGIDNAEGEYVAFLDADDIFVDEDALEKMYNYGAKNNADMIGGNLLRVNNDDELEENFNYASGNYMFFSDESEVQPEDYGIPWAFYKNIFKTSFLNENNIRFPDLLRGQDPVFLSEILTKIDKIYAVNTNLYGYYYNATGQSNDKINTTDKKRDYLMHYKQSFDVLDANNFTQMSDDYKETFISILKIKERNHDDEYVKILFEVFPDIDQYFRKDTYPYSYLSILRPSEKSDTTVDIDKLLEQKEEFINTTLTNNEFIELDKIIEYNNNLEKVKDDEVFIQKSYSQINDRHNKEQKEYEEIKDDMDKLSDEISKLEKSNNEILSSNAWKYTKFLRDIKHHLK
jgi:glycosyltransferase involved in cell wall biosynthesis